MIIVPTNLMEFSHSMVQYWICACRTNEINVRASRGLLVTQKDSSGCKVVLESGHEDTLKFLRLLLALSSCGIESKSTPLFPYIHLWHFGGSQGFLGTPEDLIYNPLPN